MGEIISNSSVFIGCLIICVAKILEITIQSMKTVFLVKGNRFIAAFLAFIECLVWACVVSSILTDLQAHPSWLIAYCLGYALGIYLGGLVENIIAIGTTNVEIMVNDENTIKVEEFLKSNNFGFTIFKGQGSKEAVNMILIVVPRKKVKKLLEKIRLLCDGHVFEVTSEVSKFVGGYGVRK